MDGGQAGQLRAFLVLLSQDPQAPTAVRDSAEAVDVHVADSLVALSALDTAIDQGAPPTVADVGSGAGLPGIVLAVARPAVEFDLVEATGRKCKFLDRVLDALELPNAQVRCARAEELPLQGLRESYGLVLARAVAPLATLVEYAAPLLAPAGELLAWKGARDPAEESSGRAAALEVGLEPFDVRPVTPYEQSQNRHLYLYRKVSPCPPRFPRRPGRAQRRPLA